jgi:hypothetical protein
MIVSKKSETFWNHAPGACDKINQASKTGDISGATVYNLPMRQNRHRCHGTKQVWGRNIDIFLRGSKKT